MRDETQDKIADLIWRSVLGLVTVAVLIAIATLLAWLTPLSATDAAASISLGMCAGLLVDAGMRE